MARNENIAKAIEADLYLKPRKEPTEAEQQLYLKEVSFVCPLCGTSLRHRKQGKPNKLYQIAHIFPNSPTDEQYKLLSKLPRLGKNSESFENKIALCKNCHGEQDYHTTQKDYLTLLKKKKQFISQTSLQEATLTMGLEDQIADVVERMSILQEDELARLNYQPVKLSKKFNKSEMLIKNKIGGYVTNYYPYIRDKFKEIEGVNGFRLEALSLQIKSCFIKMDAVSKNKNMVYTALVDWVMAKTLSRSRESCEAVVAFFVQNCEVFHEITK